MNRTEQQPSGAADQAKLIDDKRTRREQNIFTWLVLLLALLGFGGGLLATKLLRPGHSISATDTALQSRSSGTPATLSLPRAMIDFRLTNSAGQAVSRADFQDKYLVVSFVFTSCSLSCLVVNQRLAEVQRLLHDSPDVRLISLTVDPRSDTPAEMGKFAKRFQADLDRWHFLTGDKDSLYPLIEASFLPKSADNSSLIPGGFLNTSQIMLVDPSGNVCASFDGMKRDVAQEIVQRIRILSTLKAAQ